MHKHMCKYIFLYACVFICVQSHVYVMYIKHTHLLHIQAHARTQALKKMHIHTHAFECTKHTQNLEPIIVICYQVMS